ncbi:hypothetical protein RUND412_004591 [Rhizina undulata]
MYHRHVCDEVVGDFYTFTVMLKFRTPLFHLLNGNNDVERVITLITNNLFKLGTSWAPIKVDMQPISPSQETLAQSISNAQSTSMATLPFPRCHPVGSYPTRSPTVALTAESNGNGGSEYGQGRSIREEIPHKTFGDGDAAFNVQGQEIPNEFIGGGATYNVHGQEIPNEIIGGGAQYNVQGLEIPYEIVGGGVACNLNTPESSAKISSVQMQEIPNEIIGGVVAYEANGQGIPSEIMSGCFTAYTVQDQEIPSEITGGINAATYDFQNQESQAQELSPSQMIREALWNHEYAGPPNTYSTMKYFHTVFLIDNSVAMSDQSWDLAFIIMSEIVPACTNYDRDGVDIYFLNHSRSYAHLLSVQDVANVFHQIRNGSITPTGKRVSEIFIQYINKCVQELTPQKPLSMIVITDGASSFPQLLETCIKNTAMELHSHDSPYNHCWIEFLQVARSETVEHYLKALDKSLSDKFNKRDEGSLREEGV